MLKRKLLSIRQNSEPLISSNWEVERENTMITLRDSRSIEEVFFDSEGPEIFCAICELKPLKVFNPQAKVSGKFKENTSKQTQHIMEFNLYDGSAVNMANFISGIEIEFKEFDPEQVIRNEIPEQWYLALQENKTIYTKNFETQINSCNLQTFKVGSKFATKLHEFAGYFYKGAIPKNIQQHFFFMTNKNDTQFCIKIVSPKDIMSSKIEGASSTAIQANQMVSLEDCVRRGEIKLTFENDNATKSKYQSTSIRKYTFISPIVEIFFKRFEE
jgi:hypothetical protein